jgi:hypothetical protein
MANHNKDIERLSELLAELLSVRLSSLGPRRPASAPSKLLSTTDNRAQGAGPRRSVSWSVVLDALTLTRRMLNRQDVCP